MNEFEVCPRCGTATENLHEEDGGSWKTVKEAWTEECLKTKRRLSMKQKDYELIARYLEAMRPSPGDMSDPASGYYWNGYRAAVNQVAGALSADNPRFDRARFLSAVGYSSY